MAMNLHRDKTTKKTMAVVAAGLTSDVLFGSGSRSRGQEGRQKRGSADRRQSRTTRARACQVTTHESTVLEASAGGYYLFRGFALSSVVLCRNQLMG